MTKPKNPPPPPTAFSTVQKSVVLLDENLNRLHKVMKQNKEFNKAHMEAASKMATKAGELLDATRKHEQSLSKQVSELNNEEKREVFLQWFEGLSPQHQKEMFVEIRRLTWGDPDQSPDAVILPLLGKKS